CNSENPFTYEPTPYSYNDSLNLSDYLPQPQYEKYFCELCRNDAHYGYDCPQNSPSLDQFQPSQYPIIHQPPQETSAEMLQAREHLMEAIQVFLKKYDQIPSEEKYLQLLDEILPKQAEEKGINKQVQKKQEEKSITELLAEEQAARINSLFQDDNPLQSFIYQDDDDDDDDYDKKCILSTNKDMFETPSSDAITTFFQIEEPKDSLIMEDEYINTIPEKELNKDNESSVKSLFHIPSESEVTFDNESECNLPIFDDFSSLDVFEDDCVIFSRPFFDFYGDTTSSEYSSDNESILEEDVFSNLPFEFDIYPLLEEFASELALINPIPSGIDKVDFDHEGDSRLVEKLSYANSSPRPPEELNYEDIIEFFSAFPIPVEGKEKNSGNTTTHFDYSLPIYEKFNFHDDPVEEKNSGSTTIHAEISLPEYESFNDKSDSISVTFDYDSTKEVQIQIPNVSPTHPTFCQGLDFTLFTDFSGSDLVVSFPSGNRNKTFDLGISIEVQSKRFLSLNEFSISFISNPLSLVLETLLHFHPKMRTKFSILEFLFQKRRNLLISSGFKAFKIIIYFLNEISMMIYRGDIPIWDVPHLHFYPP
ncbi:hypothetical protein Tco_1347574, partial [Tanacetum coccineum]